MARHLTSLATRYAGRPLLLTPRAAHELADRIRAVDPRSVTRESRFSALIRRLSGQARQPLALEDDDDLPPPDFGQLAAYAPRYVGEVDDSGFCWSLKDGVALMNVDGPLLDRGEYFCGEIYHGYDTLLAAVREAAADERVKGIFIRHNSPGGVVAGGLPVLAEWLRENSARAGGKPIWSFADMACSADYWFAASTDRIFAPRVGLVGSIGAVIVHESWAKALDEFGVEITPIQFGAKKTDGAWWEKLSDSARADLQAEIDQCGRDFVADVVAGRPQLTEEAVLDTEARVFMGHHDEADRSALELGLIDAHAGEEEAFLELVEHVAAADRSISIPAAPAASATKDTDMKRAQVMAAARKAGLPEASITALSAALPKAVASAEEEAPEGEDDTPAEEEPAAETPAEDAPAQTEAQKIAASPEAAANPALANAAIRDGLTLAQFQGQAKAAAEGGSAPRRLESVLSGSQRLGADAGGKKADAGLDVKAVYGRRAERRKGVRG